MGTMQSKITEFLNNNYREFKFKESASSLYKNCDKFFQKRVRTLEGKTRYYINAYIYDFSKFNLGEVRTSFEMVFYDNCKRSVHITLSLEDFDSIKDFEEYVTNLFIRNNFVDDIHNE